MRKLRILFLLTAIIAAAIMSCTFGTGPAIVTTKAMGCETVELDRSQPVTYSSSEGMVMTCSRVHYVQACDGFVVDEWYTTECQ